MRTHTKSYYQDSVCIPHHYIELLRNGSMAKTLIEMKSRKQKYKEMRRCWATLFNAGLGLDNVVNLLESDDKFPVFIFQLVFEIELQCVNRRSRQG